MSGRSAVAMAVVVLVLVAGVRGGTRLGDCTHNLHCGPESCCLVGFMRYSIPTCLALGDVGSFCNPAEPSSRTLHYPNDIQVVLEEAYFGMCPCRSGLECVNRVCREPEPATDATPSIEANSLNSENDY
ncbi:astakine-like [Eriocheir sinensis]|uniref:astakine-like n=1 Tax=Eriocheir sinensis TaxID=95602 RepID=UPI0021C79F6E|nr:astakine-like [Eriocheir sinensis]